MKPAKIIIVLLLASFIYALLTGSAQKAPSAVNCRHRLFSDEGVTEFSYIYSMMFLGCREKTSREQKEQLRLFYDTGTGHLLSISGLHVGSIALSIFMVLNTLLYVIFPALRRRGLPYFWISVPIGLAASITYVCLIGAEVPRIRAIIMLVLGALCLFLPLLRNRMLVLSLAATIVMTFMPDAVYSYSFYYSFIAVFAIFISSTKSTINICAAIFIFLLPLNLHSSGSFDIGSIAANFVVIPLFSLFYYPLNAFLLLLVAMGAQQLIQVMDLSTHLFMAVLGVFSRVSQYTRIETFNTSLIETLILYALIVLFFVGISRSVQVNRRGALRIYIAVSVLSVFSAFYFVREYAKKNEITDFEIQRPKMYSGSGDMILIHAGNSIAIVDTGFGGYSSQKIIREIKRRKLDRIHYLVLTHMDKDHIGGLEDVLRAFRVENIVVSPSEREHVAASPSLGSSKILLACEGLRLRLEENTSMEFLHPSCAERVSDHNASVLSFVLNRGAHSVLFTSDIPAKRLKGVLKRLPKTKNLIHQMAHHCNRKDNPPSHTNRLRPALGFCTRDNTLLGRSVLDAAKFHFPIFMTGRCGDIRLRLENSGLAVFSQKCPRFSLQLK